MKATDLIVETNNPSALDAAVQHFGAVLVEGSENRKKGTCHIRVFEDPGFVRFAIERQGYGKVVDEQVVS